MNSEVASELRSRHHCLNMKSATALPLFLAILCTALSPAFAAEGELKVIADAPAKVVNFSADEKTDWSHWGCVHGVTILNRKAAVRPVIGDLVKLGTRELHTYENNPTTFAWSDGAPAAEVKQTRSGVFTYGQHAGFQIALPADTTPRTAKVFCGVWRGQGKLEAALSDGSAPVVTATKDGVEPEAGDNVVFTIRYRAASAGQTLSLKWINTTNRGNVTFQAVTLNEKKP